MIKDLSACLLGQSLRVDCRYENKTSNPLTYEFSITKDNRKHVIHSTISVSENVYRSRANVTMHKNLVCLYLQSFTTSDEGVYMCELKATNDYTGNQIKNITVIKGERGRPLPSLPPLGLAGPAKNPQPLWCPQRLPEPCPCPAAHPLAPALWHRGLCIPKSLPAPRAQGGIGQWGRLGSLHCCAGVPAALTPAPVGFHLFSPHSPSSQTNWRNAPASAS